jgi:hypothetical protein
MILEAEVMNAQTKIRFAIKMDLVNQVSVKWKKRNQSQKKRLALIKEDFQENMQMFKSAKV